METYNLNYLNKMNTIKMLNLKKSFKLHEIIVCACDGRMLMSVCQIYYCDEVEMPIFSLNDGPEKLHNESYEMEVKGICEMILNLKFFLFKELRLNSNLYLRVAGLASYLDDLFGDGAGLFDLTLFALKLK